MPRKILILGASYGSLLGAKLALAGHEVKLVCLPQEAALINAKGAVVRMPVKGREGLVELNSKAMPGQLSAAGTADVNPKNYDLVGLAMQEPQYRSPGVRELLDDVATSRVPCMSIMNMPPLPYLARVPGIDPKQCVSSYTDASVWANFDPKVMTLCSPDPQAFRPPEEEANVLQVRLPTNFKAARFDSDAHTAILRELAEGIERSRFEGMELPVKLKVHDSVFVPLAKWAMLLAGNYRCVQREAWCRSSRRCTATSRNRAPCTSGWWTCASRWAPPATTWCRSTSTPMRRSRSAALPRPRARLPPAHPTSSASIAWSNRSPPSAGATTRWSTRWSSASTRGW